MGKNKEAAEKETRLGAVGGQAVIEGVMMKSKDDIAIAVRKESGEIVKKVKPYKSIKEKIKVFNIPIIRGFINFIEMMSLSMSTMTESADMLGLDDIIDEKSEQNEQNEQNEKDKEQKNENESSKMVMIASIVGVVLGLALSFGLFFALPTFIGNLIKDATKVEKGWFISTVEGITRLTIFVVYILLVSLLKDIRRTFEYHGAEHMSVFCYEANEDLTVENVRKHSRFHPRCGTSFLTVMMIIGVIISSIIPATLGFWQRLLVKLMIFPFVIGIGFEFIKYAGKHSSHIIVRIISAPGLWIQRLTTKKPDDQQLEVAIVSLRLALKMDTMDTMDTIEEIAKVVEVVEIEKAEEVEEIVE